MPFLVISPYTPAGTVIHSLGYFESTLAFMEDRWNLGCIGPRDCNAPNLLNYFDFNMTPRPPIFFDPNWLNDSYPMTSQHFVSLDTTSWVGSDARLVGHRRGLSNAPPEAHGRPTAARKRRASRKGSDQAGRRADDLGLYSRRLFMPYCIDRVQFLRSG